MANGNVTVETDNVDGITPGRIEGGDFSVTHDGAATYTLPLWVPPGRLGIQPQLSLQYHSRGGNGLLGVGWSLAGLSQITRGKQTIADDGGTDPVRFTETDRLYLDGERLILTGGTQGEENSEYRTKRDTFTKFVLHDIDSDGTNILGPTWFEAFQKDGRIFTYGGIGQGDLGSRFEGKTETFTPLPGAWLPGSLDPGNSINDQKLRDDAAMNYTTVSHQLVRYAWAVQYP